MKYYLCIFNEDYADEHNVPATACFTEEQYNAWLGNSGDCFGECYDNYLFMKDFVADDTVKVTEVDESFYNFFHAADMSGLSLCNIFEREVDDED